MPAGDASRNAWISRRLWAWMFSTPSAWMCRRLAAAATKGAIDGVPPQKRRASFAYLNE